MNPLSMRLLGQQLICPQFDTPHDVVAWMGAMQAQDYRGMRWAVAMRTRRPSCQAFVEDYNAGRLIRAHLLRSTWHLVTAEDYGWMTMLCADKSRRGIREWIKSSGIRISEDEEGRFQEFLAEKMQGRGSLTRPQIEALVREGGFPCEEARIRFLIYLAEVSGVICSGTIDGNERSWMLSAERVPPQEALSREQGLERLARAYFRSHAPATLEDYLWWTGLSARECRIGMEALGGELIRERWKGIDFYVHQDCRIRGARPGRVHLLPPYDEYLIAYKSRQVCLPPEHRHHAHDQKGIFWPVVLLDGHVVGNWSSAAKGVTITPFNPDISLGEAGLRDETARYRRFLER